MHNYDNMRIELVDLGPLPKEKFDSLCRATLRSIRRVTMTVRKSPDEPPVTVFRDPQIQAEFEAWLKKRKKNEEQKQV